MAKGEKEAPKVRWNEGTKAQREVSGEIKYKLSHHMRESAARPHNNAVNKPIPKPSDTNNNVLRISFVFIALVRSTSIT